MGTRVICPNCDNDFETPYKLEAVCPRCHYDIDVAAYIEKQKKEEAAKGKLQPMNEGK